MTRLGQRWPDAQPCGTDAGYTGHLRRGERPCYSCRQANARRQATRGGREYIAIFDPREVRNGLPEFRPYVYRGTGADAYTGEVVL